MALSTCSISSSENTPDVAIFSLTQELEARSFCPSYVLSRGLVS